ncbi:acyltransferase family protein [Deinococcus radiopugnans]|uniref:Acyltransferase n=1 Tax=Deinococcus radiopugnans ATCC 19172 TaxID=585398 RepID=A0A5C4YBI8_9DEIO|nr:acyltransferase [Deinococcus radiopugnans]MBB6015330.1 peptidoglycan/LPS O-acetylase OafA/YrhL [Deinococcus radiopugnans ATCC 19172]TNM72976.1 acyltransferase [Deinococcus radiopugnans ATCC 19172]
MYDTPLFALVGFAVAIAVALYFTRQSLFFRDYYRNSPPLIHNIEGIRGYLAFAVFLHHALITIIYFRTDNWSDTNSRLYNHFGTTSVGIFFIITAFLFWGQALDKRGRFNVPKYLERRVLRIAPLYLFATTIVMIITAISTGFTLHEPVQKVVLEIAQWYGLGALNRPDINGFPSWQVVSGVYWTLGYEWKFYLALPIMMVVLRYKNGAFITAVACLFVLFAGVLGVPITTVIPLFLGGMISATVWRSRQFQEWQPPNYLPQIIALVALSAEGILFASAYGPTQVILLTVFFLALLKTPGTSVLGRVLRWPASQALGLASYSIYILHGIILYVLSRAVNVVTRFDSLPWWGYSLWILILAVIVVSTSLTTFHYIEFPFFKKGRKVLLQKNVSAQVEPLQK